MSFTRALIALPLTAFEDFSAIAEQEGLIKDFFSLVSVAVVDQVIRKDGSIWVCIAVMNPQLPGWDRGGRLEKCFRDYLKALPEGSRQFITMTDGKPQDFELIGEMRTEDDPPFRITWVPTFSANFRRVDGDLYTQQFDVADPACRIRQADIDALKGMLLDAYEAVGRDIIHGDCEGASPQETAANILGTIRSCVIERWAAGLFPKMPKALHPDDLSYPDDDRYEEEYRQYGFDKSN